MPGSARPRAISAVGALLALTIGAAPSARQIGAINGAPPGPRTAMIAGQILDAAGAPVPEAIVRLTLPRYALDLPTTPKGRVMADREGRFYFGDLPAGDYYLQATKEGYAGGVYGQREPSGQSLRVNLAEGERRTDATLTLWKYAVIAGTVVDEAGEPVVGVGVRALPRTVVGGRQRFGNPDLGDPSIAVTDDRGMFRLSQLLPGTYVVVVPSTQTTLPIAVLESAGQDAAVRSDLFRGGIMEAAPRGQPRILDAGDVGMLTLNRVLIPPPPGADGRMQVYRTTYFPAATAPTMATPIELDSGGERSDLTIALEPVPAVRVSGRLVTPDGSIPPMTSICLTSDAAASVVDSGLISGSGPPPARFETVIGMSDARGRFTLLGVPSGEYVIRQCSRFLSRPLSQGTPAYWISQRLTVGTSDVLDVAVELRPGLRVEGAIEFRPSGRPSGPPLPAIRGLTFETAFGEPGRFAVEARDGRFATIAPGGRFIARPYEIGGWFVQSVRLGDTDLTDRPFDLQADTTSLVVTYTDMPAKVSGVVRDTRGAIRPGAVVLAFPVDQERWSEYGPDSRLLKSAVTSHTGAYVFENLPAGEYHLVAVDAITEGWRDPKILERLAGQATKLVVNATSAPATIDLTLKAIR
jgi:hypothetical protein